MDKTEGFQCLGHSNWIICSPLRQFCSGKFSTFSLSYWEANSYYPRRPIMEKRNSSNSKTEWDRGVSVPGAFKLDHLQPFKPILLWKIFNFFNFILGSQFLLPQRANNGKREILATSNMDETEGFQCLGHSNWTTCSMLSQFCSEIFLTDDFHAIEPISLLPHQDKWTRMDIQRSLLRRGFITKYIFLPRSWRSRARAPCPSTK